MVSYWFGGTGKFTVMARTLYFISHPDVIISASQPVTQWPLSDLGRSRMKELLRSQWIDDLTAVYCSTEQKAVDGAKILGEHLGVAYQPLEALGENDRSSTGFLAADEFERTADEFFAKPSRSVRGWETAVDAQSRIVDAVRYIDGSDTTLGDIAIVSHGAVGTLLYCHVTGKTIDRRWDQPGRGGGNFLKLRLTPEQSCEWWYSID